MTLKEKLNDLRFQDLIVRDGKESYSFTNPYDDIPADLMKARVIGYEEKILESKYIIDVRKE